MLVQTDKTLEILFNFRLAQLRADSEYATASLSQANRFVAYGLIALIFPLVMAAPEKIPFIVSQNPKMLLISAMFGFISTMLDVCQQLLADSYARNELKRLTKNLKNKDLKIESPTDFMDVGASPRSVLRAWAFWLKLGFSFSGVVIVFISIARTTLHTI